MYTILVIVGGFIVLALMLLIASLGAQNRPAAMPRACAYFVPLWATAAAVNMAVGILYAGYTLAAETPILRMVYGVPAAATIFIEGKFLHR